MKLVFVTQVYDVDDNVLGFVPRWVEGLAKNVERLQVLALEVGHRGTLPANVEIKEIGRKGRLRRWLRFRSYLRQAFAEQGFTAVLAHMVPRYATLADPIVRKHGGHNFLWYTHKGVDARLERAARVVDKIFTASDVSLRLDTPKKVVTGHGIDLEHFPLTTAREAQGGPRLLSVGRLTPSKDPITALQAMAKLRERGLDCTLQWIGDGLVQADLNYSRHVLHEAEVLGVALQVDWAGMVPYRQIPARYAQADLLLSTSRTGSVDKVVLEAMASGLPVVASGEAYPPLWTDLDAETIQAMTFPAGQAEALADRIQAFWSTSAAQRQALGASLRSIVEADHEVERLMGRLVQEMRG